MGKPGEVFLAGAASSDTWVFSRATGRRFFANQAAVHKE
jgi:hypothetical protein